MATPGENPDQLTDWPGFSRSRDYLGSRAYGYVELPNLRLACRRARTGQASQEFR